MMLISHSSLLLFVTGGAILLMIPGPAVMYVVSRSIGHGRAAGLVSVMGIVVGTLFHVVAATLGLSALLGSSALAFQFVKYLGAAYLIFIAMIFDGLDGRLARFTRHTTDFGGQLDSLADVISFGAAPALIAGTRHNNALEIATMAIAST